MLKQGDAKDNYASTTHLKNICLLAYKKKQIRLQGTVKLLVISEARFNKSQFIHTLETHRRRMRIVMFCSLKLSF